MLFSLQTTANTHSIQGTGWLGQAGAVLLVALVWAAIFQNRPLIPLFSPHPLLQSVGVLVVTEAILILQPTSTAADKVVGARAHGALNLLSFIIFTAGEYRPRGIIFLIWMVLES